MTHTHVMQHTSTPHENTKKQRSRHQIPHNQSSNDPPLLPPLCYILRYEETKFRKCIIILWGCHRGIVVITYRPTGGMDETTSVY